VDAVISARPGYWDVDRCSWVGVDPVYVVPPLRHADHPHDRAPGAVPAPRADSGAGAGSDEGRVIDLEPGTTTAV
jgi:hypothetical protein